MLLTLLLACAPKNPAFFTALSEAAADRGFTAVVTTCPRSGSYAPVRLAPEQWAARIGAGISRFSALATTKAMPVEVCGVQDQLAWLTQVRCDDGTNPFGSLGEAHASRAGNVGGGGRCGSIIDLYVIPCPERNYEVYMDLYVCPMQ